ncbi:Solute carrier family 25 member 38 [Tetrabaena socialis]|uniref:Solute carrier family 25 member 38 n=1 Tax=Tetrabaena socialis TaxID=47790 RepID=A0A2J8A7S3_9CHLO|nr:Solute carrier family 25 member 38 [Tetrabaena socialis]|eukprot:PNH08571.1 Solute carrier family 25 member 38 [Tetrabaena socialis]
MRTAKKPACCKIYYSLLALCYFEVLLWTFCLLASAAAPVHGHSYLIRETQSLKFASGTVHPAVVYSTPLQRAHLQRHLRYEHQSVSVRHEESTQCYHPCAHQAGLLAALRGFPKKLCIGSFLLHTEPRGAAPPSAMADIEKRRSLIPFRIPLPNPLAWRPPFIPGFGRRRKDRSSKHFASTSVVSVATISDSVLTAASGSASAAAASAPAPLRVPLKPASDVLAGALARAASQSTIHPLDTLKVRLQTRHYTGAAAARAPAPPGLSKIGQLVPPPVGGGAVAAPLARFDARAMLTTMGSLYRGVVGAASGAGIAIGAYFAVYGVACNTLSRYTTLTPTSVAFVGGGVAALGSSFVKVPLAVCIRSVQAGVYPNVFAAARSITAAAGTRGLFTGYLPTVLEDVPDMAIKFAAYESMRQLHRALNGGRNASVTEDFAMGAVAGALAAAATTPLDVIKTNMMCNAAGRPSMGSAAALVLAQGGPRGFFRGVGARALSNGINSAVFFCFFEAIRGAFAEQRARRHPVQIRYADLAAESEPLELALQEKK